jgi:hypothetical protein
LATSLDWAYTDLRASAQERFSAAPGSADHIAGQAELARLLLEEQSLAAGRLVWAYEDVEPMMETLPSIGHELPLVVFIRVPDTVVQYAAVQSPRGVTARQLATVQYQVRGIVEGLIESQKERGIVEGLIESQKERAVILDLPRLPVEPDSRHDVDLFFDAYVDLAFQAVRWLHRAHGGPSLGEARGILGALWRSSGRSGEVLAGQ